MRTRIRKRETDDQLLHRACQRRSRHSQRRIEEAALHLLESRLWEEISIADIVQQAGLSVGGFYSRFKSKDALLELLHRAYETRRNEGFARFLASPIRDRPLEERVAAVVGFYTRWMHDHRGILRTFLLAYWSRPKRFAGAFDDHLDALYRELADLVVGPGTQGSRPEIEARAPFVLAVVAASCRDRILKPPPGPGAIDTPVDAFTREMTAISLSYLGSEASSPPREAV